MFISLPSWDCFVDGSINTRLGWSVSLATLCPYSQTRFWGPQFRPISNPWHQVSGGPLPPIRGGPTPSSVITDSQWPWEEANSLPSIYCVHPPWAVGFICLHSRNSRELVSRKKHSRDSWDLLVEKKLRLSHSIWWSGIVLIPSVVLDYQHQHPSGFHTLKSLSSLNDVVLLSNLIRL